MSVQGNWRKGDKRSVPENFQPENFSGPVAKEYIRLPFEVIVAQSEVVLRKVRAVSEVVSPDYIAKSAIFKI